MSEPERISHSQVRAGDQIVLPEVGGGVLYVEEVLPGQVGGLLLQVTSAAGRQRVQVPWRDEILRVSSTTT